MAAAQDKKSRKRSASSDTTCPAGSDACNDTMKPVTKKSRKPEVPQKEEARMTEAGDSQAVSPEDLSPLQVDAPDESLVKTPSKSGSPATVLSGLGAFPSLPTQEEMPENASEIGVENRVSGQSSHERRSAHVLAAEAPTARKTNEELSSEPLPTDATSQEAGKTTQLTQKSSVVLDVTAPTVSSTTRKKKNYAFRCKFSQTVAFKSFFENLGNVLAEVTLEVRKEPGVFSGIIADSMDPSGVTLVHGKISGDVQLNVPMEQAIFCITIKDILDIFPNLHPQHFVELYRIEGSTDVVVHIYEPSLRATNPSIHIQTLDKTIDTLELNDMNYSYYVEVELNAFKNAMKTAKNQIADSIQFLIYEIQKETLEKSIYFVLRYKGVRTSVSFPYESKITLQSDAGGPTHLKAVEQDVAEQGDDASEDGSMLHDQLEELEPKYQGTFLSRYLFQFVKSMERSNITLRLASDKPLIIDYPLGCSNTDGLRFVLAPTAMD